MLIEEEIVRFEEEEELRDNSDNLEGDLSYNYKHPVQNGNLRIYLILYLVFQNI